MKCLTPILIALALTSACATAAPRTPPVPLRIVCTVPTPWDAQACWVEFGTPVTGQRVEVASQSEGEKLIAILLENSGRRYVFDSGLPIKAKPLPATAKPR